MPVKNKIDYSAIGRNVKDVRRFRKYSQEELGEGIGNKRTYITSLEGGHEKPTTETLGRIAEFLNADITISITPRS